MCSKHGAQGRVPLEKLASADPGPASRDLLHLDKEREKQAFLNVDVSP